MKLLTAVLSLVLGLYSGIQSYRIASAGVSQQIPQLQGDGGGGIVFALLCIIAAVVVYKRLIVGASISIVAAVVIGFVGLSFGDPSVYWWGLAALALGVVSYVLHRLARSTRQRYGSPTPKNRSRVG